MWTASIPEATTEQRKGKLYCFLVNDMNKKKKECKRKKKEYGK